MKQIASLLTSLITALALAAGAQAAHADPRADAQAAVERELAKLERPARPRKSFSRGEMKTRPRLPGATALDANASVDDRGQAFYGFRAETGEGTVVGCIYTATSHVFIVKKNVVYPVAFLAGKRVKRSAAGTCVGTEASPVRLSQAFAVPPPRR